MPLKTAFRVDRGHVALYPDEHGRLMLSFEPYDRPDDPDPDWPGWTEPALAFPGFPLHAVIAGNRAEVLAWIKQQPFGQPLP